MKEDTAVTRPRPISYGMTIWNDLETGLTNFALADLNGNIIGNHAVKTETFLGLAMAGHGNYTFAMGADAPPWDFADGEATLMHKHGVTREQIQAARRHRALSGQEWPAGSCGQDECPHARWETPTRQVGEFR